MFISAMLKDCGGGGGGVKLSLPQSGKSRKAHIQRITQTSFGDFHLPKGCAFQQHLTLFQIRSNAV